MKRREFSSGEPSGDNEKILKLYLGIQNLYFDAGHQLGGIIVSTREDGTILQTANQDRNTFMQQYRDRLPKDELPTSVTLMQAKNDNTYQVEDDERTTTIKADQLGRFYLPLTHETTNTNPTFDLHDLSFMEQLPSLQAARGDIRHTPAVLSQLDIAIILKAYDKTIQSRDGLQTQAELKTAIYFINLLQENAVKLAIAESVGPIKTGISNMIEAVSQRTERLADQIDVAEVYDRDKNFMDQDRVLLLPHEKRLVIAPVKPVFRMIKFKLPDLEHARDATDGEWIQHSINVPRSLLKTLPQNDVTWIQNRLDNL